MRRATTDQIIAHVDLLRAVDRLLTQAEIVRAKREALDRLLPGLKEEARQTVATETEGRRYE
jgi:hypothetical protein